MSNWTEGYTADIPYAVGFYRETVPAHIAFAAVCVGRHPSLSLRPRQVLELGFGMGLGFVINAASNPNTQFEGIDFNPEHVAHARGLVEMATLPNISLREASFQDAAREAVEGQQDVDIIVLHGILTWVSTEAHSAIVEIARKRLKPGGLLYVSYNCMPGRAMMLPMQRLMRENAKRVVGSSHLQTKAGLELIQALNKDGAGYFRANPTIEQRIDKMATLDAGYLAHEYMNANWHIFYFSDVAEMFSNAKLGYIGSATIAENVDGLAVPEGLRGRIAAEPDPIFKETLRDFAANKQFRRDLYGRGVSTTNPTEQNAILRSMHFALAVPRSRVTYKFTGPLGEVDGNPEIYGAIVDRLAHEPASFADIAMLPALGDKGPAIALQALALLIHSGQVLPALATDDIDPSPAQRLNNTLVEKSIQGRAYNFLAAPVAGSGIPITHTEMLILAAVLEGHENNRDAAAQHVISSLQRLNVDWTKDGKSITDPQDRYDVVVTGVREFMEVKLPLLRQLRAV